MRKAYLHGLETCNQCLAHGGTLVSVLLFLVHVLLYHIDSIGTNAIFEILSAIVCSIAV